MSEPEGHRAASTLEHARRDRRGFATGRRIALGGVAGTALLLSLTACLGESGDGEQPGAIRLAAAEAIAKSSAETGQEDTFKATVTIDNRTADGNNKIRATGRFRLKPSLAFSGSVDELSRNGASVPGGAGAQAVLLDRVAYVRIPTMQALAGGKPWFKVDLGRLESGIGVDVDQILDVVEKVDPAVQTKMFTGSSDVRRVGSETIDGVKTTHYVGTVGISDALSQLDAQARAKAEKFLPEDGQNDTVKLAFDVWIDGDNLPRKVSTKVANAKDENSTLTVVYRDYGKPVNVTAPPPSDVGEFRLFG